MVSFFILYTGDVMTISYADIIKSNKIIDIRNRSIYNKKNIDGTINIPRLELLSSPSSYIKKGEIVYILCDEGYASLITAKILNALGYNCYSIEGGIEKILG